MMIGNYPKYQQTMHHVLQCILADSGLNIGTIGTRGHSHDNLAMMKIPSEWSPVNMLKFPHHYRDIDGTWWDMWY